MVGQWKAMSEDAVRKMSLCCKANRLTTGEWCPHENPPWGSNDKGHEAEEQVQVPGTHTENKEPTFLLPEWRSCCKSLKGFGVASTKCCHILHSAGATHRTEAMSWCATLTTSEQPDPDDLSV